MNFNPFEMMQRRAAGLPMFHLDVDFESLPEYTTQEIARHRSEETGFWTIVDGIIIDVTEYRARHRGGAECLEKYAGFDCTGVYGQIHAYVNPQVVGKDKIIGRVKKTGLPRIGHGLPRPSQFNMGLNIKSKDEDNGGIVEEEEEELSFDIEGTLEDVSD
ncbi:hypothetical protein PCE1_001002 [Barthelona sp. PCE]